ncbi:MAG: hypothetical protein AAGC68_12760, partial [Verrucomicrobiota bacterium]
ARSLSEQIEERPQPIELLLSLAPKLDRASSEALIEGMNDGMRGWRKAPKPGRWDDAVAALSGNIDDKAEETMRELSLLFGDGRALDEIKEVVLDREADFAMRKAGLETLIEAKPDDLREICESLLSDRAVNVVAVKGLTHFEDDALGQSIARQYRRFSPTERASVMESLVSRPSWSAAMLQEMEAGRIPKTDLSAFQARQIDSFGEAELSERLAAVWGEVRTSSVEKRELIEKWTETLEPGYLAEADLGKGRQLYAAICGSCHLLYGEGGKVGPDLTGSGRSDLGYLLENIIDPGAVVSADYQMSIVTLRDGRLLTGVVSTENEKTVALRQLTGEVTVEKAEIEKRELSPVSMMPEGLLQAFETEQVRDLIAYLKHPVQVLLPD